MKKTRRDLLKTSAVLALAPAVIRAESGYVDISWGDLVPDSGGMDMDRLRSLGVVQHGQLNTPFDQEMGAQITSEFDGKRVRLPGYLVPLDYTGKGMTSAILVPYVGACIHVPPPPPNQLVFVTSDTPYQTQGLFEPVYVTGLFGSGATATELAEIGYALTADDIEPYF